MHLDHLGLEEPNEKKGRSDGGGGDGDGDGDGPFWVRP